MHSFLRSSTALCLALVLVSLSANAQRSRIAGRIDNQQRVTLPGNVHPRATAANEVGRVAPAFRVPYVTVQLSQSASQQADLANLLAAQQDLASASYHQWLTPAQYADRFGASPEDVTKMTDWLRSQGLNVLDVAQGRDWIAVSGEAAQVEAAFSIELHQYAVNGETHFANATEPSVPAAIGGVVMSIRGLHDFKLKPAIVTPKYTKPSGNHYLAPNDFAAIYDILPAYAANINGAGQTIVVAGQTAINLPDIQSFQSEWNLPANPPQTLLVPGTQQGISKGDLGEADLDLEWSGAVARNATILYVYSDDVFVSAQYAIDHNLGSVLSSSYGSCELENSASAALNFRAVAQKANAEGITWVNASGDNGAADCNDSQNPGLAVDLPSSVPEVTGVGGTRLLDSGGQYWNSTNDANGASVVSYIPEISWNDRVADGSPSASGGGASVFYSRPSWQTGPGVPADNARHVPDIAMTASADHDAYLVYTNGSISAFGGTSAPAPAFAGMLALLNQYLVSTGQQKTAGLGNVNIKLYALAQSQPSIFHDITSGDNGVTVQICPPRRSCTTTVVPGYTANAGYDSVTGLGSIDAWQLMNCWSGTCKVVAAASANLSLTSNLSSMGLQDIMVLTSTATSINGAAKTPVGTVVFTAGTTFLGSADLTGSAGTGSSTATLSVIGGQLPLGASTITATYSGTSSSVPVTSSLTVSVRSGSSSQGQPAVSGLTDAAAFQQTYSPGMIMAVFGSTLSPSIASAGAVPLPFTMAGVTATVNGQSAPLYYVSPAQINVQIPWEAPYGANATLSINNNGTVTSKSFAVSAASPGIFTTSDGTRTLVPYGSGTRGQLMSLYLTGTGAVSPAVATGAAPAATTPLASLPAPQAVSVTVGGMPASITCAGGCFAGIPYGLVGVTQINFQLASNTPTGRQPVVVTTNGVVSQPAFITVN